MYALIILICRNINYTWYDSILFSVHAVIELAVFGMLSLYIFNVCRSFKRLSYNTINDISRILKDIKMSLAIPNKSFLNDKPYRYIVHVFISYIKITTSICIMGILSVLVKNMLLIILLEYELITPQQRNKVIFLNMMVYRYVCKIVA